MLFEAVQRWMNELSAQGIFITDTDLTIQGWNHWLEDHQQLLSAGYHMPLAKPVDLDKLVTTIAELTAATENHQASP